MASVKIILKKDKRADGTYPVAIRITKDRKSSFVYLDYGVKESDWDPVAQRVKRSHPNYVRMNNFLIKKLSEATDSALDLETKKSHVSSQAVRQKIMPSHASTFFPVSERYLEDLKKAGKYNQYTADKPRFKHLKEFLKSRDIGFSEITVGLLNQFKAYLKGGGDHGERSAVNHWVAIRSVFSYARKHGIIDDATSPFGKGKIAIKFPDSTKVGLNRDEVKRLEAVDLDEPYNHARNLWMISYFMAGMRISDVLRLNWNDIQDGRLYYIMGKNNKGDSLKIPERALTLIEKYRAEKDDTGLIFPDLRNVDLNDAFKAQRQIAFTTSRYDKFLRKHVAPAAGIDKKLTMHISRHTFAQNATDIEARTLQKLFRHTDLSTTVGYMGQFINKQADDALDLVIG